MASEAVISDTEGYCTFPRAQDLDLLDKNNNHTAVKLVGVWWTTWLDWDKNTCETCKKAYARLTILTKLKYVGVPKEDLIQIYILFVHSLLEYCSTVWHSTLTVEQSNNLERVQNRCLKIILGEDYQGYDDALEKCGLERLTLRREASCILCTQKYFLLTHKYWQIQTQELVSTS